MCMLPYVYVCVCMFMYVAVYVCVCLCMWPVPIPMILLAGSRELLKVACYIKVALLAIVKHFWLDYLSN